MAYNSSTGKVTAPVSIADVQSAVGNSSGDLGYLITNGNINCWAKYKPVQLNQIDTTGQWYASGNRWKTPSELGSGVKPWWQGVGSAICGITPKQISSIDAVRTNYDGNMNGWVYSRPAGNSNQPYRLTDFAMYNANAKPPVANFTVNGGTANVGRGSAYTAIAMMNLAGTDEISLTDIGLNGSSEPLYFGIYIYKSSSNNAYKTATTSGDATVQVTSSENTLAKDTYQVYPFLCNKVLGYNATITSGTKFYTCPNAAYFTMKIVDPSLTIDATVTMAYTTISATNRVTLTIKGDTNRTLYNPTYYVLDAQYYNDPENHLSSAYGTGTQASIGTKNTTAGTWEPIVSNSSMSGVTVFAYVKLWSASNYGGTLFTLKTSALSPPIH